MSNALKLIPSFVSVIIMAMSIFSPAIQSYIASHPAVAASLAGLATILANAVPAPVSVSMTKN